MTWIIWGVDGVSILVSAYFWVQLLPWTPKNKRRKAERLRKTAEAEHELKHFQKQMEQHRNWIERQMQAQPQFNPEDLWENE